MRKTTLTGGRAAKATLIAATAGLLSAAVVPAAHAAKPGQPDRSATGSAFGLAVAGPVSLGPLPQVSSSSQEVSKSLLRENRTGLLSAGALDVKAAADRAQSSIAKLAIPSAALKADAVTATCTGATGSARLVRAAIGGTELASAPSANSTIPVKVPGVGTLAVTLNKQERLADGRLRVTALAVDVPLGGRTQIVRVASATCGQIADTEAPEAPAPAPVNSDLPVTG